MTIRIFYNKMWKTILFLTVLFSLSSLQSAMAISIFASDCSTGFKNVYFDNEPVCAFGGAPGGSIFGAPALACVIPPGSTSTADDVTAGGCNAVPVLASFWEEFLWLPPTVPGDYTLIIVNNQGGFATDSITILPSGGAAPTVNVAAIKAAAGAAAGPWRARADWGEYLDEFHSAISIAWAVGTGDVIGAAVGVAGAVLGFPTDYNGAVLQVGGQMIAALSGQLALKYETLQADPPDPLFTDIVPLDIGAINTELAILAPLKPGVPLQYPFSNLSQDSLHLASTKLGNSMAEEAALVFTLMRTLEKYQGAEAAANDEFTLLQARALKKYADQLGTQLSTTRQIVVDYKAELTADGLDAIVYDGADVAALTARLMASGLTAAEEQSLRDAGFTDADILVLFDRINAFPAPTGLYSRGGGLDNIVAAIDAMGPVVLDLGNQAQAVVDHFAPLVTVQHPSADAGGPYNANEGTPVNFDGSSSSDPQVQALTYEWDFNLDGQFDDAAGISVSNTYNSPIATQVGLRVTDTDGNADIAYATVVIAEVNGPPEITSFNPVDLAPTASNLSPLDFSATASDPDFDALGFEWRLDGVVMSTAMAWTYTPGLGETGTRTVRLTVSDLNPLSEDAIETRVVLLVEDPVNQPPAITSTPVTNGTEGELYTYDVDASDPDVGDVLTFNLDTAPAGMTINTVSGLIQWTPAASQLGDNAVTVRVSDDGGLFDTQAFMISVISGNAPPSIISTPVTNGTEGELYTYDVDASDPDVGDVLTFNLDTAPAGMTINTVSGLIQWTPAASQLGDNAVTVRVTDDGGLFDTQAFTIAVVAAGEPPVAPENLVGRAKLLHVNVAWSGSDTADRFRVFRRLDSEIDFSEIGQTAYWAFVDDLPNGTLSAEYFVVAENAFGQSDPSSIITVAPTSRRR